MWQSAYGCGGNRIKANASSLAKTELSAEGNISACFFGSVGEDGYANQPCGFTTKPFTNIAIARASHLKLLNFPFISTS
jgi:hypothetical protein